MFNIYLSVLNHNFIHKIRINEYVQYFYSQKTGNPNIYCQGSCNRHKTQTISDTLYRLRHRLWSDLFCSFCLFFHFCFFLYYCSEVHVFIHSSVLFSHSSEKFSLIICKSKRNRWFIYIFSLCFFSREIFHAMIIMLLEETINRNCIS